MTPEEEAAELLPCDGGVHMEGKCSECGSSCGCARRPAVADRLRERDSCIEMLARREIERCERIAELEAERVQFYGSASEAAKLSKEVREWLWCDLNSEGPGPTGGRKSRAQKGDRLVDAVCALEAENERLRAALDEVLKASKTTCARGHDSICDCGGDMARAALARRKS